MVLGLYFLRADDAFYHSLFVDDESSAESTHVLASVHALFTPNTKFLYQLLVSVGNKREGQVVLFDELLVRLFAVDTYTDYFITGLAQFIVVVAQVAGLGGAARCAVFGVEVENDFLSLVVAQADFLAFFVSSQYFGSFVSYWLMVSG